MAWLQYCTARLLRTLSGLTMNRLERWPSPAEGTDSRGGRYVGAYPMQVVGHHFGYVSSNLSNIKRAIE